MLKGKQQTALEESFFAWGVMKNFILGIWIQNQFLYHQPFAIQQPALNSSPTRVWSVSGTSALFEAGNDSGILNLIALPTIFVS